MNYIAQIANLFDVLSTHLIAYLQNNDINNKTQKHTNVHCFAVPYV